MATASNLETFGDRLKDAAKNAGAKKVTHEYLKKWFFEEHKIKISTTMISRYGKDELPRMEQCRDYAIALNVRTEWLLTGRGPRYIEEGPITETERRILGMWRHMPTETLKKVAFSEWIRLRVTPDLSISGMVPVSKEDLETYVVDTVSEDGQIYSSDPNSDATP